MVQNSYAIYNDLRLGIQMTMVINIIFHHSHEITWQRFSIQHKSSFINLQYHSVFKIDISL